MINALFQLILFASLPFLWWLFTSRKKEHFLTWIGIKRPVLQKKLSQVLVVAVVTALGYGVVMMLIMNHLLSDTTTAVSEFENQGWSAVPKILAYAIIKTGLSEKIFQIGLDFLSAIRYKQSYLEHCMVSLLD